MACLPKSGGCERFHTDALVEEINSIEGTCYQHRFCLDVLNRSSQQPEALYVDAKTGHQLVVERKTAMWPPDHAKTHQNDHLLADTILRSTATTTFQRAYTLELPSPIKASKTALRGLADEISGLIIQNHERLKPGSILWGETTQGRWQFFMSRSEDINDDSNNDGITFKWPLRLATLDPRVPPAGLVNTFTEKLFRSCVGKFSHYHDARRILQIEPSGQLSFRDVEWWREFFQRVIPPELVGEIWCASQESTDFDGLQLFIEKVYPANTSDSSDRGFASNFSGYAN